MARTYLFLLLGLLLSACNKEHEKSAQAFEGERPIYWLVEKGDTILGENGIDEIGSMGVGGGGYGTFILGTDTADFKWYTVSDNTILVPRPLQFLHPVSGKVLDFSGFWSKTGTSVETEAGFTLHFE